MHTKVEKLLIKWGHNANDVARWMDAHFSDAQKFYPNATASKLADYIQCVS